MPSLEDGMMERVSKEIAEEIDWEILADIFKACGWVTISFNPKMLDSRAQLVKEWLKNNCKGHYRSRKDLFMFELESDAVNFSLKWA
jgi:hypothetical protein